MKANFSLKQISNIAPKVRFYKKLFVTTEGQMFKNLADAEAAVRIKNIIIDDANEYVGIVELTADAVTDEKLRTFAKMPSLFNNLFKDAKTPVTKTRKPHERKREKPVQDDKDVKQSVDDALGLSKKETVKKDEKPVTKPAAKPVVETKTEDKNKK